MIPLWYCSRPSLVSGYCNKGKVMILCIGLSGASSLAKDRQDLHCAKSLFINLRGQGGDIDIREIRAVGKGMPAD